ncbi:hypothetical protein LPJ66_008783 [Kickxella alabastrina]|uniref:Uncharacterized protein n=1 Tax=Kickxella alabastrina TaxID=61397 RepID=A0ACC1I5P7_9FUNG|nr:hypothetical protein LPJ66_008783 [Kickxella alabastrina]
MLELSKTLPLLSELVCNVTGIASIPDFDVMFARYIKQLHLTHYPLNRKLNIVQVLLCLSKSSRDLAKYAITLAVLCPDFVLVTVEKVYRYMYNRHIQGVLEIGELYEHAHRIESLIYKE